jgi:hypothetical protein
MGQRSSAGETLEQHLGSCELIENNFTRVFVEKGHSHVRMTQDRYMTRGRIHTQVADLLHRKFRINDE